MTQDLRPTVQDLQRRLAVAEAALIRERADLETVRAVLGPLTTPLSVAVQELLNYAVSSRRAQAEFADLVRMLQSSRDAEAKAIGNSMDALFRTTPIPQVLVGR